MAVLKAGVAFDKQETNSTLWDHVTRSGVLSILGFTLIFRLTCRSRLQPLSTKNIRIKFY